MQRSRTIAAVVALGICLSGAPATIAPSQALADSPWGMYKHHTPVNTVIDASGAGTANIGVAAAANR